MHRTLVWLLRACAALTFIFATTTLLCATSALCGRSDVAGPARMRRALMVFHDGGWSGHQRPTGLAPPAVLAPPAAPTRSSHPRRALLDAWSGHSAPVNIFGLADFVQSSLWWAHTWSAHPRRSLLDVTVVESVVTGENLTVSHHPVPAEVYQDEQNRTWYNITIGKPGDYWDWRLASPHSIAVTKARCHEDVTSVLCQEYYRRRREYFRQLHCGSNAMALRICAEDVVMKCTRYLKSGCRYERDHIDFLHERFDVMLRERNL